VSPEPLASVSTGEVGAPIGALSVSTGEAGAPIGALLSGIVSFVVVTGFASPVGGVASPDGELTLGGLTSPGSLALGCAVSGPYPRQGESACKVYLCCSALT